VRPSRLDVAGFALSFALSGVLLAVYLVAGEATYASLAAPDGAAVRVNGAIRVLDRTALLGVHRATIAYALGEVDRLPDAPGTSVPLFDPDERSHMADVRGVFAGVRAVLAAALIVLAWRLVRGLRGGPVDLSVVRPRAPVIEGGVTQWDGRRPPGEAEPAARVHALFARLVDKETDPKVLREIAYRDPAALPRNPTIRSRN